jgi:LacI family transcriptional regulator
MRYRIREIAAQAGLSEATVDRVLHERGGVRESTVHQVHRAVDDLDRQRAQLVLGGRTFMIDVVVQAPSRFSDAVRAAVEAELPALRPVVFRARFHRPASPDDLLAALDRIPRTGSHGVILKAPDVPPVVAAVNRLDLPVVTLVTDLPASRRTVYVGIDNRAAGATAAYLVQQWLGERPGDVLVVRGEGAYRGEDERAVGFGAELRSLAPARRRIDIVDAEDRPSAVHAAARAALRRHPEINAVYSMYAGAGGTTAVIDAFRAESRSYSVFIAHDLDGDNTPCYGSG